MRRDPMTAPARPALPERVFRAAALGVVLLVVVPMAVFVAALPLAQAAGLCDPDLPVLCEFAASDIALVAALPGFLFGAGLSVLLDRRRPEGRG
ncbi:MAG: hypothetical protein ACK4GW_02075 [Pseudorhodobacter sp.]